MKLNERILKIISLTIFSLLLLGTIHLALTLSPNVNFEKAPISSSNINIIDLGTLPNYITSKACDINNLGEIIGESDGHACYWSIGREIQVVEALDSESTKLLKINDLSLASGWYDPLTIPPETLVEYRPFIWSPLSGELDLVQILEKNQGQINSVNNLGQAVGWTYAFDGNKRAFLWTPGEDVTYLGTLGGSSSEALDINDLGQIIGSETLNKVNHAFFWTKESGMLDIGSPEIGNVYPNDLNNLGQVVGSFGLGETDAFLWSIDTGMMYLESLEYTQSFAYKINDQGYIIGGVSTNIKAPLHAALWTPENGISLIVPIDPYGSEATDINNLGQIVGYYYLSNILKNSERAFLWTFGYGFMNLTSLGGEQSVASAINDCGQVVGTCRTEDNHLHAVIWEIPQQTTEIIINVIEDLVEDGELSAGQGTALTAKLESAIVLMDKGKYIAARNLLQAFINQVNSLIATGSLPQEEGYPLIIYAQELIDLIFEQI